MIVTCPFGQVTFWILRLWPKKNHGQTVVVELKKGQNTVRLHNDHERMPDVDYLSVETQ